MENINQTNIKNHIYYFLNDMINNKNFNPNLLKIDKKSHKNTDIYTSQKKIMIIKIFMV